MQAEQIASKLLHAPLVTALAGDRIALARLPHNAQMPALVYNVVSDTSIEWVDNRTQYLRQARLQVNPIAHSVGALKELQQSVITSIDFKQNVDVGESFLVYCRLNLIGPMDKDDEVGVWTQPTDFLIHYYPKR